MLVFATYVLIDIHFLHTGHQEADNSNPETQLIASNSGHDGENGSIGEPKDAEAKEEQIAESAYEHTLLDCPLNRS